jgi:hypothetical protein
MRVEFLWHPYRYFPYERVLASRELASLIKGTITATDQGLVVETTNGWKQECARTTYFREAVSSDDTRFTPLQAALEASANGKSVGRQSTRYSAHGLHEYRGKFNPQIVRAIGNIIGLKSGNWVLDPFCGSGTTLLEAAHGGWNAVGTDLNPLAVEIANAKIAALRVPISKLNACAQESRNALPQNLDCKSPFSPKLIRDIGGSSWQDRLPSITYLREWFAESVLVQLALLLRGIDALPNAIRLIFRVILSDIVREVSLQDPGDLRIRRRKNPPQNFPVITLFFGALSRKLDLIAKAREHLGSFGTKQKALVQDARYFGRQIKRLLPQGGGFDAVITSPPYATALPYIDTQRLSLVILGLISAEEIRKMERSLIGNREIGNSERIRLELALRENVHELPHGCITLCRELLAAVGGRDGFRRQNVPALIYKYFVDMSKSFEQIRGVMKPKSRAAIVIGPNSTTLGGREFVIDTTKYLTSIACTKRFNLREELKLDTYQRFDIHRANSITAETLLLLEMA